MMCRVRRALSGFMVLVVVSVAAAGLVVSRSANADAGTVGSFAFSSDVTLSPRERVAEAILAARRATFLLRNAANPDRPFTESFMRWRGALRASSIHRSLRRMPKGGLQHVHASAVANAEWIVDRALREPECFIYRGASGDDAVFGQLAFFPAGDVPPGWVRLRDLKRKRPNLRAELLKLITLGPEDARCPDIWKEFEDVFLRIDSFLSYRPVFMAYYREGFLEMARDGLQFIELRTSIDPVLVENGTYLRDEAVLELYRKILSTVRARYPEFDLRIIMCSWRGATLEEAAADLSRARGFTAAFPDLVQGFDVIAEEDTGNTTAYYAPVLESEPRLPLYLHGGESLSPSNHNVREALDLGALRISHGINLDLFGGLEDDLRAADVVMEVCPISNQVLRYVPDLRDHPAKGWLRRGLQCVLGSDDPGIYGSLGATDDFAQAYLAWNLDLRSLKKLALNSITASTLPADRMRRQLEIFETRWRRWIDSVIGGWGACGVTGDAAVKDLPGAPVVEEAATLDEAA